MKVKICGITNLEDAAICEMLGADALGFVHFSGRRRSLTLDKIAGIASSLGPMTTKVLVCAPDDVTDALSMMDRSGTDILQTYTLDTDSLDELRETGVKVIRAVPVVKEEAEAYADHADALLFEKGTPGTGASYDYSQIPMDCCARAIIAGGLNLDNLHQAISLRPYALDVSSGVESPDGSKDPRLVEEFMKRCRQ